MHESSDVKLLSLSAVLGAPKQMVADSVSAGERLPSISSRGSAHTGCRMTLNTLNSMFLSSYCDRAMRTVYDQQVACQLLAAAFWSSCDLTKRKISRLRSTSSSRWLRARSRQHVIVVGWRGQRGQ